MKKKSRDGWLGSMDVQQSDKKKNVVPTAYPFPVIHPVNLLFQHELI
jgi:hypothetical protein